ncbi:hypothetical protein DSM19430T_32470 [Desulfovibrio psychrotolerans]|uniref:Uncharacterized protein n=1 Tax=Desulfovibrio psychrotolerans TaxID=415242 RepID=A0A7J0BY04_9BACT|nr:hypothetical protein DSM19430T_32470 [Desulfovibrio psychrotolerans]
MGVVVPVAATVGMGFVRIVRFVAVAMLVFVVCIMVVRMVVPVPVLMTVHMRMLMAVPGAVCMGVFVHMGVLMLVGMCVVFCRAVGVNVAVYAEFTLGSASAIGAHGCLLLLCLPVFAGTWR